MKSGFSIPRHPLQYLLIGFNARPRGQLSVIERVEGRLIERSAGLSLGSGDLIFTVPLESENIGPMWTW